VTGLDSSERILAVGRQKAEREPPEVQARIRLLCGDMTDFDLSPLDRLGATLSMVEGSQRFRLVLIPFNSLQLLPSLEGQRKTIICAARHLVEGGRLALEVNPGFKNLPSDANEKQLKWTKRWAERNLTVMAYERVWQDRENQATVFDMRFELVHDRGDRECTDVRETLRWTSLHQMEQLLKEAGLRVISSYGDFRRSPVPRVEGRLVLVAAKE
jgi:SAM-dependent methyltransferase